MQGTFALMGSLGFLKSLAAIGLEQAALAWVVAPMTGAVAAFGKPGDKKGGTMP